MRSSLSRNVKAEFGTIRAGEAIKALLLLVAGLFLAWLVFKTSAVDGLLRSRPNAAARVAPDDPRPAIEAAMHEFGQRNGRLSRAKSTRAVNALADLPLAEEPFLLSGLIARVNGDMERSERLLAEARRRNPRSRMARLILLDNYLRANQVAQAAGEIRVLTALIPQAATVLIPELARMARNPKTRPAMVKVLAKDPVMRRSVLEQLASSEADPDLILSIAKTEGRASSGEAAPWQALLIGTLVEKGDTERAYRLWRTFIRAPTPEAGKSVYDGRFEGLPGAAPFNWKLMQSNAGVAERTKRSALEVSYYGRLPTELASQLLMLPPGRYRLEFRAEGDAKGEGSRLVWTVSCHKGTAVPLELPLKNIGYAPRRIAAEFTVPAGGCGAQWLKLSGVQGEFPTGQNVTIGDVGIRKAGPS